MTTLLLMAYDMEQRLPLQPYHLKRNQPFKSAPSLSNSDISYPTKNGYRSEDSALFPFRTIDAVAVLVGLASPVDLRFLGKFTLGEIFLPVAIVALIAMYGLNFLRGGLLRFTTYSLLYLFAIIISNVFNAVPLSLAVRGMMQPVFLVMLTVFFVQLNYSKPASIAFYFLGYFLYSIPGLSASLARADSSSNTFVYGMSNAFAALGIVATYALFRTMPALSIAPFGLMGTIAFLKGARGYAFVSLLCSAVVLIMSQTRRRSGRLITSSAPRLVRIIATMMISSAAIYGTYIYSVQKALLGAEQVRKYQQQTESAFGDSALGLILSARPSILASWYAIQEHPILGLGSWPEISAYTLRAHEDLGLTLDRQTKRTLAVSGERAPGHSILLAGWVQFGIPGLIYWLYIAFLLSRSLLIAVKRDDSASSIVVFPCLYGLWALAFSPWGIVERSYLAIAAASVLVSSTPNVNGRKRNLNVF